MIRRPTDRVGQRFGPYEITKFLGRGGFADVFLGKNVNLPQQEVAIKVLDKLLIQEKALQFKNEANIILSLRHPHIIQFYTYDILPSPAKTVTLYPYIVMEYAPKGSLRSIHPRGTRLPLTTIVTYVQQIASALQYAHGNQVMHLDVKPENILVNSQGKLLLSDFGLATLATEQEKVDDVQGTLSYMPPEQIRGKPDKASDQYALGVMVYEWICGNLPFRGRTIQEFVGKLMKDSPPSLIAQIPTLSPAVEAVVMRALSKNVRDRYPSVLHFAEELEKAINQPANVANALPNDPNNIIILPQLPAPQAGQSGGGPGSQALPTFLAGAGAPNQVGGTPESQLSAQLAGNQAGVAPDPQAQSSSPVRTPPNNQAGGVPESPILGPLSAVIPPVNQAGAMPDPQIPGGAGGNQAGAAPDPQAQSPFLDAMPPANQTGAAPDPQALSPFLGGAPPGNQVGGMSNPQSPPFGGLGAGNPGGTPPGPHSPFLNGRPTTNQAGAMPNQQAFAGGAAAPPPSGSPFLGASSPVDQQFEPGLQMGPMHGFTISPTVPNLSPPSLPPYLGRPGSGMDNYDSGSVQNSIGQITRDFIQPRLRRRPSLLFTTGIIANVLGSIFVGIWLGGVLPSYGNETAWWGFLLSLVCSVGAFWLFDYSRNKLLRGFLAVMLAIFWGFVGNAFAILVGAGTRIGFLPDADVMSVLFLVGSFALHLWMMFRRP